MFASSPELELEVRVEAVSPAGEEDWLVDSDGDGVVSAVAPGGDGDGRGGSVSETSAALLRLRGVGMGLSSLKSAKRLAGGREVGAISAELGG